MARIASSLLQLKESPGIIHQVLLMLRVHSIHLPVFTALIKQRAQKKLCKPAEICKMAIKRTSKTIPNCEEFIIKHSNTD